jgi:amino acid transporter
MLEGENLGKYHRWAGLGFHSYASILQPVPAWLGLISCIGIVFALNALSMLRKSKLVFKALSIYLGVRILLSTFPRCFMPL